MRRFTLMLRIGTAKIRLCYEAVQRWARSRKKVKTKGRMDDDISEDMADDTLEDIVDHYFDPDLQFYSILSTIKSRPFPEDETTFTSVKQQNDMATKRKYHQSSNSSMIEDVPQLGARSAKGFTPRSRVRMSQEESQDSLEMSTMVFELDESADYGSLLMADPRPFNSSNDVQIILDPRYISQSR